MDLAQAVRQKRLKAGTACTNCRRKKLRCTGTPNCVRCVTHKLDCIVDEALFLKTNSNPFGKSSRSNRSQQQRTKSLNNSNTSNNNNSNSNNSTASSCRQNNHYGSISSSYSGDEMLDRRKSPDFSSDRRMSTSSSTSFSSLSPSPSPAYTYNYSHADSSNNVSSSSIFKPSSPMSDHQHSSSKQTSSHNNNFSSSYRSESGVGPLDSLPSSSSRHYSSSFPSTSSYMDPDTPPSSSVHNGMNMNKKRASKGQETTSKPKQKRRDDSHGHRASDPGSPSPLPAPKHPSSSSSTSSSKVPSTSSSSTKNVHSNGEDFKSVVSTMSLDGHGQHFHGSSSGFYVCQLSSRYRQGVYPLPMAHLNDSDLWSHSLQMTSERELPTRAEMDNLLSLYFRFMYPFAPMFIRKDFMERHQQRPDLPHILILNAIFCNACWYSDDPLVRQDSTKYFNRAKIILDETYHVSGTSTIQALLLMSHHQYAVGNYSGGWLYTGMATRIAHDIGLHRQDFQVNEPIEAEVRKRVWWAVYIADRLGAGILGRPLNIRDKEYNVEMPSDDWITAVGGDDAVEYPFEPERVVSIRLLWTVKLFMQMGKVLNTMHCIEAEINGTFLADISKTQLPQLHNSLTSWFLSLPNELMYTPYTMSPNSNHPPSPPTALMHMFYYTTLTMLHRPYLRPVNSAAIDSNFLVSSRNICTAAATNVCHIADSLMLHGQLRDTCYYGMACLLAAGTVHVHNAITPTPSNRETTRAGLSKTVKAAHELVKTFPVAESLIAVALDVFASQTTSIPTEMAASFIDISTFVAPFLDMSQLASTSIGNIYEAARLAKLAKDGPGPAPSIQLRHPYGNFSMPLPEQAKDQSSTNLSLMWQNQISTAVAMAAIAFGGTDPQQEEQQFFANPLELPEALRLAPIDTMAFHVDGSTNVLASFDADPFKLTNLSGPTTSSTPVTMTTGFEVSQQQAPIQRTPTLHSQLSQDSSFTATQALNLMQATLASSLQVSSMSSQLAEPPVVQTQQLQHTMMEDDTADPPSPPAISSDDMDTESLLSNDTPSPSSSPSSSVGPAPRHDISIQCGTPSPHESFIAALAEGAHDHDSNLDFFIDDHYQHNKSSPHVPGGQESRSISLKENSGAYSCQKDVKKVNTLLFDNQVMEC
ncbi:Transcriptional activator of fatty acid utilization [Haplosporangium gracile]|nr:Transcriptional activator of fatty acid utilization [Haplosporangium gracile]